MRIVLFGSGLILAGLLLAACGGGANVPTQVPDDQARRVAGHDQSGSTLFGGGAGTGAATGDVPTTRKVEDGPYIKELWLQPDPPLSHKDLRGDVRIENPATGYLDTDYQWFVNGEEVMGATSDTLSTSEFGKGDVLELAVTTKDINGRDDSHRFRDIRVANSKPEITSRIGSAPNLDGFTFQARDPDGDPITWRLEGAPRGVSIGRRTGLFRIDTGQQYGGGAYSITVVADDGDGGEGTMTFQATLSGGQVAKVEKREVQEQVGAGQLSDEQLSQKADEMSKKIEDMTEEELEAYLERSAKAQEEMEAVGATETGVDVETRPAYVQ